tara:strand:- start:1220 stop:1522 length:303 start_codon:yes stop_codon:yes gene_type:complete
MSNTIKHAIDELENKIIGYRKDCLQYNECKLMISKLNVEIDNIKHSWYYEDEDLLTVTLKLNTAISDLMWYREAVDLSLHAVKHAAYRLGRFRSFTSAEP